MYGTIYRIINKINGKIYIGQTIQNPKSRWACHKRMAKQEPNSMVITRAMAKYGIDHFVFEVVDQADDRECLDNLEKKWIIDSNSLIPFGYNVAHGGFGRHDFAHPIEDCLKISQSHVGKVKTPKRWQPKTAGSCMHKRKPVKGTSLLTGEVITFASIRSTEFQGFNSAKIVECCKGRRKVHKSFTWEYV